MPDWNTQKGISITDATPTGDAGVILNDNFERLRDETPFNTTSNPSASDDSTDDFFAGSQWFNTSTHVMWICTDATATAAVWKTLYKREAGQIILSPGGDGFIQLGDDLNVNGQAIVSLSNGDIPLTPHGTGKVVLDGLNWPTADGSTGQVLKTNGTAGLYFGAGGGGAFTADGSMAAFQGTNVDAGGGSNIGSFAQGSYATASGNQGSFAQGVLCTASGDCGSFAQGSYVTAVGYRGSFAQGYCASAYNHYGCFAQGNTVTAVGQNGSFAQGGHAYANGDNGSFAQGASILANGTGGSFAQGKSTSAVGGKGCFAQGEYATASANGSWASGYRVIANKLGQFARATGRFAADGDAQMSILVARRQTTDATPTVLFLDGSSAGITIASGKSFAFSILVVARQTSGASGTAGDTWAYQLLGAIKNIGGTTSLQGTVTQTVIAEADANFDCTATANNTTDALDITVTGAASKNVNWVATIYLTEVA